MVKNMDSGKRWGKRQKDDRDWVGYNEELVVRGEFLLDTDWVKSWNVELEAMNQGKVGAKYEYPESLIKLQAIWHQWFDYRGIEGVTRKLVEACQLPDYNDYTTANRRVNKLDVKFRLPKSGSVSVSCDGSGMQFGNAGEHRERMYGNKNKRFIKIVITADPKTKKLLECDVSIVGEELSEPEIAEANMKILIHHGITISKFWGDGSYDVHNLFDFLDEYDIESAIKIRKNAVLRGNGCRRDKEVQEYRKWKYKKWAKKKSYGLRWLGTEGIFSAVKRKFGEKTSSRDPENAIKEVRLRFWVYDEMKEYARMLA